MLAALWRGIWWLVNLPRYSTSPWNFGLIQVLLIMGSLNNDLLKPLFLSFEYLQNFYLKKTHVETLSKNTPWTSVLFLHWFNKKPRWNAFFHQVTVSGSSCVVSWKFFTDACGESHSTHRGALTNHICWWFRNLQFEKIDQYSHIYIYTHYIMYENILHLFINVLFRIID